MTDSLTTLISKVQGLLGDDGTIFDTTVCTSSAREALKTYNQYLPVHAGDLIDAVSRQHEYDVTAADDRAISILDVLLQGTDNNELDVPLTFDPYDEDERLWFRLRSPQATGQTLIVRYTIPQTINGLDAEIETTIPAWLVPVLVTGIAAEALRIRSRARVETINLNKDVRAEYAESAREMKSEYIADLRKLSAGKRGAVGEPDVRAWNDGYHGWGQ